MSDHGSDTASGGNGLIAAGVIIAALVGAGVFLSLRQSVPPDDKTASTVVTPVETTAPEQASDSALKSKDAPEATHGVAMPKVEKAEVSPEPSEKPIKKAEEGTGPDAPATEAAGEVAAVAPKIDEVRVDQDGILVVAGRAVPGSRVDVLVDGEVVTSADADSSGAFAALGAMSSKDAARTLTLQSGEGTDAVASDEEIILAPLKQTVEAPAQTGASETEGQMPDETDASTDVLALAPNAATQSEQIARSPSEPADGEPVVEMPDAAEMTETAKSNAVQAPPETSEIAVLRSDPSGVSLVEKAPVTNVVLDTIGYSDAGDVQLGGRADLETVEIRAYLNNRAVARLPVTSDGNWRGEVPDVEAGVYTLRVDALKADGSVSSRIETPFKREEPSALAAATDDSGGPVRAITVQAGDTLWAIARDRYGEGLLYVQVFEANRDAIRDPDLIYPGQVFDLPGD